jgi:hypothetical protein
MMSVCSSKIETSFSVRRDCDDEFDLASQDAVNDIMWIARQNDSAPTRPDERVTLRRFRDAGEGSFHFPDEARCGHNAPLEIPLRRFE